ncbi:MAG TPA: CreA family protein [Burkholderiaceae bacterium]|nr:CreA family protein [Burkholderiaceae bacterium]
MQSPVTAANRIIASHAAPDGPAGGSFGMPARVRARTLPALWLLALVAAALPTHPAAARQIGEVDTVFKLIGPDHKVVVDAYDDPKVQGVSCYVSRAKTGGIKGALGVAEDRSEASIDCRQVGPISFARALPQQEEMFSERTSLIFKRLRVVRMVDSERNALVYLSYSDRLIEGSPQNSVTAVPVDRATPIPVR